MNAQDMAYNSLVAQYRAMATEDVERAKENAGSTSEALAAGKVLNERNLGLWRSNAKIKEQA